MKKHRSRFIQFLRTRSRLLLGLGVIAVIVGALMGFRLGTIVPGLSPLEHATAQMTYGWHGVVARPFDLPLNLARSAVFVTLGHQSAALLRLPNVVFGILTIIVFAVLIKYWHGTRTALFATALFATSAWLLHVSRLASSDVLYLLAIPLLLIIQLAMLRASSRALVFYGSLAVCGLLLYIPGLVWLVLLSLFWQRAAIRDGWQYFSRFWQRSLYILTGLVWLPLLIWRLASITQLKIWLGLPPTINIAQIGRQLFFVPVHLLGRGPNDPQRWLGHAPLLDAFSLVVVVAGIWFYAQHYRAVRTRILLSYSIVGLILVSLGGSVGLSLLVPLLYVIGATGLAYLLHEWLAVFPVNPIARRLGITLIALAVAVSCIYNLRAYFVAWPHDRATLTTFRADSNIGRR